MLLHQPELSRLLHDEHVARLTASAQRPLVLRSRRARYTARRARLTRDVVTVNHRRLSARA